MSRVLKVQKLTSSRKKVQGPWTLLMLGLLASLVAWQQLGLVRVRWQRCPLLQTTMMGWGGAQVVPEA
jgi:hypothetical protein